MNVKTKKDQIYDEILEKYGVKLDRRKSLVQMKEQRDMVISRQSEPEPEPEKKPKTVRNKITGNTFAYTKVFDKNPNLEVIEWWED